MLRTLTFSDNYVKLLKTIVETTQPTDNTMSGALELIRMQQLPVAKDWKRKTYDAVINEISGCGITMEDDTMMIEENAPVDDLEIETSDDDEGSDVEEDMGDEEVYEEEERL